MNDQEMAIREYETKQMEVMQKVEMMMLINSNNQLNFKLKYEIKALLDDMKADFESLAADNQAAVQLLQSQRPVKKP